MNSRRSRERRPAPAGGFAAFPGLLHPPAVGRPAGQSSGAGGPWSPLTRSSRGGAAGAKPSTGGPRSLQSRGLSRALPIPVAGAWRGAASTGRREEHGGPECDANAPRHCPHGPDSGSRPPRYAYGFCGPFRALDWARGQGLVYHLHL